MGGGKSHGSKSEFVTDVNVEREADAFAAGLLMPSPLLRPIVNQGELSLNRIREIKDTFRTSFVSTAIRSVQHSDFPCEVVGLRNASIAWRFRPWKDPDPLTEGKCFRAPRGPILSQTAKRQWQAFENGICEEQSFPSLLRAWFQTPPGPAEKEVTVWEHYLPVPIMDTLVVLLRVSEEELFDLDLD